MEKLIRIIIIGTMNVNINGIGGRVISYTVLFYDSAIHDNTFICKLHGNFSRGTSKRNDNEGIMHLLCTLCAYKMCTRTQISASIYFRDSLVYVCISDSESKKLQSVVFQQPLGRLTLELHGFPNYICIY